MYAGSSGVLFSLYRYGLLLMRETPDLMPYWLKYELLVIDLLRNLVRQTAPLISTLTPSHNPLFALLCRAVMSEAALSATFWFAT